MKIATYMLILRLMPSIYQQQTVCHVMENLYHNKDNWAKSTQEILRSIFFGYILYWRSTNKKVIFYILNGCGA